MLVCMKNQREKSLQSKKRAKASWMCNTLIESLLLKTELKFIEKVRGIHRSKLLSVIHISLYLLRACRN